MFTVKSTIKQVTNFNNAHTMKIVSIQPLNNLTNNSIPKFHLDKECYLSQKYHNNMHIISQYSVIIHSIIDYINIESLGFIPIQES